MKYVRKRTSQPTINGFIFVFYALNRKKRHGQIDPPPNTIRE